MKDTLNTEERKELPDSVFGLPERAAEAYFRYCPEDLKPKLAKAILRFAAKYGVNVESPTILSFAAE